MRVALVTGAAGGIGAATVMDRMRSVMLPGSAIYAAAKGGLDAATTAFARESGPFGIRVNAVAPGLIDKAKAPRPAEIVDSVIRDAPPGRTGAPEDIAGAVAFLLSEDARLITGQVVAVSGGYRS